MREPPIKKFEVIVQRIVQVISLKPFLSLYVSVHESGRRRSIVSIASDSILYPSPLDSLQALEALGYLPSPGSSTPPTEAKPLIIFGHSFGAMVRVASHLSRSSSFLCLTSHKSTTPCHH